MAKMGRPRIVPAVRIHAGTREPCVNQGNENGWNISWNPDDLRFYINAPLVAEAVNTFKDMRNARSWARNHNVKDYVNG